MSDQKGLDTLNIVINFGTLKSGGGQNVAMNFLAAIEEVAVENIELYYFVAKGSAPHRYLEQQGYQNYFVVPCSPVKRILFEWLGSKRVLNKKKIDIIYSYFGFGFFPKKIPQVIGSADSNLYFPDIDFWEEYKGLALLKRRLVDAYRKIGLKRADAVIYENDSLRSRGEALFHLKKTVLIKPSINCHIPSRRFSGLDHIHKKVAKGLFLCGWHHNKRVMVIPYLAKAFKEQGIDFHFVLTAPKDGSDFHKAFLRLAKKLDVERMITLTGAVKKDELESLYQQIHIVFLLSKLESFSNNIIEAWVFQKPLIISNEGWARSICADAAIYVDRNSVRNIVSNVQALLDTVSLREAINIAAAKQLSTYPNINQRIRQELKYVGSVYQDVQAHLGR